MPPKCFWPIISRFIAHCDLGCGGPFTYLIKSYSALHSRSRLTSSLPLSPRPFCHCHLHVPVTLGYLSFPLNVPYIPASFSFLPLSLCSCCFLYLECSSPFFSSFPFIRLGPDQIIPCSVNPALTSLNI